MAWFLYCLSWLALALQGVFIILSLASGLYYLCELVEEYSTTASKVFRYLIWITTVIFICLWLFDSFPLLMCTMGIFANLVHVMVLKDYPAIAITSFPFIMTVVMATVNHFLAFRYFSSVWYPFTEVLAYFTICLWIIPFGFFISITANDLVLPTTSQSGERRDKGRQGSGFKAIIDLARESILPGNSSKRF